MTIYVTDIHGQQVALQYDWGAQAQKAAEDHLEDCWAWYVDEEEGIEVHGENPAVGMFCGGTNCVHTCEVHEVLAAAVPFIEAGVKRDLWMAHDDADGQDATGPE